MTIYISMLALSTGLVFIADPNRKPISGRRRAYLIAAFIILFLVSAFRNDVGGDFIGYKWMYSWSMSGDRLIYLEPGFVTTLQILTSISGNARLLFAVSSAITISLFFIRIIHSSEYPAVSILLFITLGYYFSSMNILRQYIAVAIVFFATRYLYNKNYVAYSAMVLLATTFHKISVIMILFGLLSCLRFRPRHYYVLLGIGAMGTIFRPQVLEFAYFMFPQYEDNKGAVLETMGTVETLYYVIILGFTLLLCVFFNGELSRKDNIIRNHVIFAFILYLFFYYVPIINRVALFMEIQMIMLVPSILKRIHETADKRFLVCLYSMASVALFLITIGMMNRYVVLPYQFSFLVP